MEAEDRNRRYFGFKPNRPAAASSENSGYRTLKGPENYVPWALALERILVRSDAEERRSRKDACNKLKTVLKKTGSIDALDFSSS